MCRPRSVRVSASLPDGVSIHDQTSSRAGISGNSTTRSAGRSAGRTSRGSGSAKRANFAGSDSETRCGDNQRSSEETGFPFPSMSTTAIPLLVVISIPSPLPPWNWQRLRRTLFRGNRLPKAGSRNRFVSTSDRLPLSVTTSVHTGARPAVSAVAESPNMARALSASQGAGEAGPECAVGALMIVRSHTSGTIRRPPMTERYRMFLVPITQGRISSESSLVHSGPSGSSPLL